MSARMTPANDGKAVTLREALSLSLMQICPRTGAMSVAWDEAAQCCARHDTAGFDAAMRIFRKLKAVE